MYVEINHFNEAVVMVEPQELCSSCSNINNCPLMSALESELVILRVEAVIFTTCGFYSRKSRTKWGWLVGEVNGSEF